METAATPATSTNQPGLDDDMGTLTDLLPEELLRSAVFSFLDASSLARAGCACRGWGEASLDEHLWKALCLRHWAGKHVGVYKGRVEFGFGKMWRAFLCEHVGMYCTRPFR